MRGDIRNRKKYSVIIVSDATSSNKEFVISSKLIRNTIAAFLSLLVFFGFIIFHYLNLTLDKQKMKRLEYENRQKQSQIKTLSATIENLDQRLKNMEIYKDKIMVATGLTSPLALTEVGSGGPGGSENFGTQTIPSPPLSQSQANILDRAKSINENAKKVEDSLKSVESFINKQKLQLASTPAIWPTRGYITNVFGNRIHPFTGKWEFHFGIDIATQLGNKIIAPADGTVLVADQRDFYGNMIIIDHNFGFTTRYGHMASFNIREGQRVKRGDVIGFVGTTGRSTAPHLHYEVRYLDKPINPYHYILD